MKKIIKFIIIFGISAGVIYLLWEPLCHIFSAVYNFIQANPLFTSNLFNFILVAAFFVWLLFFKLDIAGMMERKSQETAKTITDSENKKAEAANHLEETKKSLENIDTEVKEIVTDAKNIAKNAENTALSKLNDELASIKNRENLLRDAQISKAKNEVAVIIANAAVAVSKAYIENSLDENTHRELIYNFIDDLDEGMKL